MHNIQSPRTDDGAIEQEIQAKGKVGPRITPQHIEEQIVHAAYHQFPGTTVTVCCITLRNGYNTVGESACVDPNNFDAEIGRKIAYENAKQKIWALEGYLLRDFMHANGMAASFAVGKEYFKALEAGANGTAQADMEYIEKLNTSHPVPPLPPINYDI